MRKTDEIVNDFFKLAGHLSDGDMGKLSELLIWTVDTEIDTKDWEKLVKKVTKILLKYNKEPAAA